MAPTPDGYEEARESARSVTDHVHDGSWSVNLENPEHAADRNLIVEQAIDAVEHTAPGYHVNPVTHAAHGRPAEYLCDELEAAVDSDDLETKYVDQCGCVGHVVRVTVD